MCLLNTLDILSKNTTKHYFSWKIANVKDKRDKTIHKIN